MVTLDRDLPPTISGSARPENHSLTPEEYLNEVLSHVKPYTRPAALLRSTPIEELDPIEKASELSLDVALGVTPILRKLVDEGWGRERKSGTVGRENEDPTIGLDLASEVIANRITKRAERRYGIKVAVFSEHNDSQVGGMPDVYKSRDPIDNSGSIEVGHESVAPFFAEGDYLPDGEPIGGICCNLLNGHISINRDHKNYRYNPNSRVLEELPVPEKVYSIKDPNFKLASYGGKSKYARPFWNNFSQLDQDRDQNQQLHAEAGAHLYGESIATGAVSAYIMFGEPISEIAQGMAFARDAGYIVASVDPLTGLWEEYKFDVDFYAKNPERYKTDRIPMFIVASTKELLNECIVYGFSKNLPGEMFEGISPVNERDRKLRVGIEERIF